MPSLHRVNRGAEVALESVAARLANRHTVTLLGTGEPRPNTEYGFIHARGIPRERFEKFPSVPTLRTEFAYEELTWIPSMLRHYRPRDYDVVVGCTFPFTHWALRARNRLNGGPPIVYVTENGDWPASSDELEYRFFKVDGLVCVNQEYFQRNKDRYFSVLAPNGVDERLFHPGVGDRDALGLPCDAQILLMVSALADNKRVLETMRVRGT